MFTGIVECTGYVESAASGAGCTDLAITCSSFNDLPLGSSVAVNGCCLTVVSFDAHEFRVDVTPHTLNSTNLRHLVPGSRVNLERAVHVGSRIDGHFVQGHVDSVVHVTSMREVRGDFILAFAVPRGDRVHLVSRGSITVSGVSLTVSKVFDDTSTAEVVLIPATRVRTTLGDVHVGDSLNIEFDVLGKYLLQYARQPDEGANGA